MGTVRKNCSSDGEKLLKFEAEFQEFAKFLRSLEQFIQTEWSEQFLVTECFFNLFLEVSHLNYYLSFDVCASFRVSVLSVCLSAKIFFSSKMDQIRKFSEQTSRILEFKPEGLEGKSLIK